MMAGPRGRSGKRAGISPPAGTDASEVMGGGRLMTVRVKTAKKRTVSSTLWLKRQLNDPYVVEAKRRGYRSRAAFKLEQLDEKFQLLTRGARVVDLGCAPGGWCQIAVDRVGPKGKVVGIDYLEMDPVDGAQTIQLDFLDPTAPDVLKRLLDGLADVVLSDMAAPTTGHAQTDHLRVVGLAEIAYEFASEVLAPGGAFVAKVFQGGTERTLLDRLKKDFALVRHAKPPASRADSAEIYVVATGFRGR
jgi:23S rRNA (uridine2552-2'-O)-methyltransferase